mgnify:CR=1 FL=1
MNDAPVNTVPGTQTVDEETQTAIAGISVSDVDAAAGNITTRLQVTNGVPIVAELGEHGAPREPRAPPGEAQGNALQPAIRMAAQSLIRVGNDIVAKRESQRTGIRGHLQMRARRGAHAVIGQPVKLGDGAIASDAPAAGPVAEVRAQGSVDQDTADAALRMLDVDPIGLDLMDRNLLLAVIEKFGGGPVGVDNLAAAIGEERDTIEDVLDRKSTRLNSSHMSESRMPSSA